MEDVSHLTVTQPIPPTTPTPTTTYPTTPSHCGNVECLNEGVCVMDTGAPVCRCAVGDDWWYYGNSCQYKGTQQEKTTLALASSLGVLGAMLVITVVSVVCVRKKYKKKEGDDLVMSNVQAR
ncbi:hypothetical protein WMY93_001293 [Mugilogobius chulae]|uniref:EGF-like domain-containing protein n=1 Tax=Mugilogobius chulae TaxID=88201 RepID=A0AAW0QCK3_9GOBI